MNLNNLAANIRIETMKQFKARGFGHVGGSLSIADILAVLYGETMKYDAKKPDWDERDYLILSKGHAGPVLYATLALSGFFPMEWMETLNQPGTHIPSHTDKNLTPGVDMTTGSLGQGLSVACGIALGLKMDNKPNKVYAILGDGECQEGQVWEAALFAGHHKLNNLIILLDNNGKQLDGKTDDILTMGDMSKKFFEYGFMTQVINGNNTDEIKQAINETHKETSKPSFIQCNTIKGAGISLVESLEKNHHLIMDEAFVERCIAEVEGGRV